MPPEHREIIKNTIKDGFVLKDKYSDYEINSNFQLLLNQLDLFRTISALVVAIVGLGFFFKDNLNQTFLITSLVFALITIVGTISYTREMVDFEARAIKEQGNKIRDKIDQYTEVAIEALKLEKSDIFFDYAQKELNAKYLKDRLVYAGEIFTFFFYLSVSFGLISFFYKSINFIPFSYLLIFIILLTYFLSFKEWARFIIDSLSKHIFVKNKK